MDPNLWDEPNKLEPSRFIDESGKIRRPEFFMPFGVGRMCLGDVLTRVGMFKLFSCIMHHFDVQMEMEDVPPSLEGTVGATIAPQAFRVQGEQGTTRLRIPRRTQQDSRSTQDL